MGVISSSGVVGIVRKVSQDYSVVASLLNTDTRISASLARTNAFGSLTWGESNFDPKTGILRDIPNHIIVKRGDQVVTSGHSSKFPAGLPIGKVIKTGVKGGESFLDIEVGLYTDFATLQYVYVIRNVLGQEQETLEAEVRQDG
jgi:rod shape-determining protein MreC